MIGSRGLGLSQIIYNVSMDLVINTNYACFMYAALGLVSASPRETWNLPSDRLEAGGPARSARPVEKNQAVTDSQIRSHGTDLGRLANHPRQAPCLESCGPERAYR